MPTSNNKNNNHASISTDLPLPIVDHIGSHYAVNWLPAGVCKQWDNTRHAWRHQQVTRIQALYRGRRARYDKSVRYDMDNWGHGCHADMVRMYLVYYPFEYLQRWPDLARRKCPDLTAAQRQHLETLPPAPERTRRDVRGVMCALSVGQIQYVGW